MIAVIGLGKAGLPLTAVIADSRLEVLGVDVDKKRVRDVNAGRNPIPEEPGLGEILKKCAGKNLTAGNYEDAKDCSAYIIIVPLFIDNDKKPDFSILTDAFLKVSGLVDDGDLVVLETTVPPGTTETLFKPILDRTGKKVHLAYSPERIMTGYSIMRYKKFPKVVGGVTTQAGKKAYDLYSQFCGSVNLVSNARTAELVKVAEGIYRDVNIALANELYKVSEELGIDYYEMRKNANHEYCHLHMPGNVGGHCIPVYPWFLINDFDVPLIRTARTLNDDMIKYYADKLPVKAGKILVIGLTYRAGVKELAYTRSIPMIELLKSRGYEVYVNDPLYSKDDIEGLGYRHADDFSGMDSVIVMNNVPEYRDQLRSIKEKVVDIPGVLG